MKILAFTPFPPQISGGSKASYIMLNMIAKKHEVTVVTYSNQKSMVRGKNLNIVGCGLGNNESFQRGILYILIGTIKGIFLSFFNKYDLVYAKSISSPGIAAYFVSKITRKPLICHTSGIDIQTKEMLELNESSMFAKLVKKMLFHLKENEMNHASAIIANCEMDFIVLKRLGYKNKTIRIYNGVNSNQFSPNTNEKIALRQKKKLSIYDFVVLFVGRAAIQKRPDIAISVANRLLDYKFIFCGVTVEEAKNYGKITKNCYFEGMVENISEYYRLADVFFQPSGSEGVSNAMLEAMASELAVVVSNAAGDAQVLIEEGENGFLCKNENEYIKKISELANDREKLRLVGEKSRVFVIDNFNWNEITKEVTRILCQTSENTY
jgi:glycosyltransferase involved in cell wall biosynthesis